MSTVADLVAQVTGHANYFGPISQEQVTNGGRTWTELRVWWKQDNEVTAMRTFRIVEVSNVARWMDANQIVNEAASDAYSTWKSEVATYLAAQSYTQLTTLYYDSVSSIERCFKDNAGSQEVVDVHLVLKDPQQPVSQANLAHKETTATTTPYK